MGVDDALPDSVLEMIDREAAKFKPEYQAEKVDEITARWVRGLAKDKRHIGGVLHGNRFHATLALAESLGPLAKVDWVMSSALKWMQSKHMIRQADSEIVYWWPIRPLPRQWKAQRAKYVGTLVRQHRRMAEILTEEGAI